MIGGAPETANEDINSVRRARRITPKEKLIVGMLRPTVFQRSMTFLGSGCSTVADNNCEVMSAVEANTL